MDKRLKELSDLHNYIEKVDTDVTMVLQNLQWDRKHLLEDRNMVACSVDPNHKVPYSKREKHEASCLLSSLGYSEESDLLPDPVDTSLPSYVKFSKEDIQNIIEKAATREANFKRGPAPAHITNATVDVQPLTLGRLQATYSADERRAIHDAVIERAPEAGDTGHLSLMTAEERKSERAKTKAELLAELRDMKRRRTKYRVAAKTRNYSDVLRDVIRTQMEVYTGVTETLDKQNYEQTNAENSKNYDSESNTSLDAKNYKNHTSRRDETYKYGSKREHTFSESNTSLDAKNYKNHTSRRDETYKYGSKREHTFRERDNRSTHRSSNNISRDYPEKNDREYSRHKDKRNLRDKYNYRNEDTRRNDSKSRGNEDYEGNAGHSSRGYRNADIKSEPNSSTPNSSSNDYYSRFYKYKIEKRSNEYDNKSTEYVDRHTDETNRRRENRDMYKHDKHNKNSKNYNDAYNNDAYKRRKPGKEQHSE